MALRKLFFVPWFQSCIRGFGSNLLPLICVCMYFAFVQRLVAPMNGAQFVSGMVPSISAFGLSLEGMPLPKYLRHPKCSAHCMEVCVCKCVCYVGLAACHLPPRALAATEKCPHRIAGDRCLGTSSMALSKQTNGD